MARVLPTVASQLIVFLLISSFSTILVSGEEQGFARALDRKLLGLKKEKLSHFRFFFHDILSGKNPTAVQVVPPSNYSSSTLFGLVTMFDDPLTLGPKLSSKMVGKAQGFYASASQQDVAFLMVMNFAFTEGKYNGSTLTVIGRNNGGTSRVREMPVVGGSRLFRFARGYAEATTHSLDLKTGDAIIEYNVYVFHY
ncbi:Dirigent protein 20 [Morella rubra]|uniref:Dirigent protein n=1 Tax=Morella rubra TaxID=262757 RepID=A0A6A1WZF1_9ROSI|nr:Dirigent protein 20 [Morella rubra]KAB1227910.1 Dirigent protein 20 [Morella rubra]